MHPSKPLRRRRLVPLVMAALFATSAWGLHGDANQHRLQNVQDGKDLLLDQRRIYASHHNNKKPRIRGYPGDCAGLSYKYDAKATYGLPPPCRLEFADQGGTGFKPPKPPPNQMTVGMYLGLMPHQQSLGPLATGISSILLDDEIPLFNFHLSNGYNEAHALHGNVGSLLEKKSETAYNNDDNNNNNTSSQKNTNNNTRHRHTRRRDGQTHLLQRTLFDFSDIDQVDMYHTISGSKLIKKHDIRWWWQVNMTFQCFWHEEEEAKKPSPVKQAAMVFVRQVLVGLLESYQEEIEGSLQNITNDEGIRFRTVGEGLPSKEEDESDTEGVVLQNPADPTNQSPVSSEGSTSPPTISPSSESPGDIPNVDTMDMKTAHHLDPDKWDWKKSLGLVLLLATTAVAMVLRIFGARRKYQREMSEFWGSSLRSQDGVQKLLNTGWVLEGDEMQIYDKSKLGYSDDDSVFLGGFEQKEAVVGTEVTITHPETSGGSRSLLSSRELSSQHLSSGSFSKQPC